MTQASQVDKLLDDLVARMRELENAALKTELEYENYRAREEAAQLERKERRQLERQKRERRNALIWTILGSMITAIFLKGLPLIGALLKALVK